MTGMLCIWPNTAFRPRKLNKWSDSARPPFPRREAAHKYRVRGQTIFGHFLQVIYLIESDRVIYVIHARPLTSNEKRQFRRGRL